MSYEDPAQRVKFRQPQRYPAFCLGRLQLFYEPPFLLKLHLYYARIIRRRRCGNLRGPGAEKLSFKAVGRLIDLPLLLFTYLLPREHGTPYIGALGKATGPLYQRRQFFPFLKV